MRRLALSLMMVALLLLGSGCAPRMLRPERPVPLSAQQLLGRLRTRTDFWSKYQAQLQIDAASAKGRFHFRSIIVAQLPAAFRLESFNLFGQTVAVLIVNQGTSTLWIPSKKLLYTSSRPERLIQYFLGVPVPLELFAYSLAACIPPQQLQHLHISAAQPGWLADANNPQLGQRLAWQFHFDPPALQQVTIKSRRQDYTISYQPSTELDLQQTPDQIRFVSNQWQMKVTISQMKNLVSLQPKVFSLAIPSGTRQIDLDTLP